MNTLDQSSKTIESRPVPDGQRFEVLPRHFNRHMLNVESAIYHFMRELASRYTGGYWTYFELSNGGFYMAPQGEGAFTILVESNGFEGSMSAEAAGMTACLFAFSHLAFRIPEECIVDHYYRLRDFALEHTEARAIFAAID